jgi:hypothetical protein
VNDSAADIPPRNQLLAELSDEIGMPVIAVANGWCGNNVVNLGEEGARAFIEVLDAELAAQPETSADAPEPVALFLVGRGGYPAFADGVWRALTGRGLEVTAIVPHRVDGALSLLALSSQHRLMHPYGALGAYDRRPLGRLEAKLDADVVRGLAGLAEGGMAEGGLAGAGVAKLGLDDVTSLSQIAGERRYAQLSRHLMKRMLGGTESGLGARVERDLCADLLGADLALSANELDKLGLVTAVAEGRSSELVWQLYRAYERELEVLEVAMPRFTQSQVADEVEFAPATGLTGAVIEGVHDQLIFELDTGSPHPDTGMLKGEWLWDRLELGVLDV